MAQFAAEFVAHTRMQNVLTTVKITISMRLRQNNFLIQLVFGNLTSCPVEGARTFFVGFVKGQGLFCGIDDGAKTFSDQC